MPVCGESDSVRGDDAASFARALGALKQQGSSLLVVGAVPDEMYERASRQMLGDASADRPRRRLVVLSETGPRRGADRLRGTGPLTPEYARLVASQSASRSASTVVQPSDTADASSVPRTHDVDGGLADLGETISEVVDQFEAVTGGLEPAELRVAFDCLPTLLSVHDTEDVFTFLHLVSTQIKHVGGIGHFRLPQERTTETALTVAPLFDAVIELRLDGADLQQRWHFRDRPLVSEWLPLER